MNIEQRARQQLAEVESAYEFHTRQAFNSDDERDEHIEAAGDCMIAADVLRDLLRGGGITLQEIGKAVRSAFATYPVVKEPYQMEAFARHVAGQLGIDETYEAAIQPENEPASHGSSSSRSSKSIHTSDCCNVEPVRTGGSVSPDQASEAVQQTVNPITFDAIHTAIRRAAGWTDTLHADSLIFKFSLFVAGELGAPIPKGTEPAPVAAEDKPASVPLQAVSFEDLSNALSAALDTNGVELHPAIARGVTCSAAERLGIPVPKAPVTK